MSHISRLAKVELQSICHFLEEPALLAFARCSRATLLAAQQPFAFKFLPPVLADVSQFQSVAALVASLLHLAPIRLQWCPPVAVAAPVPVLLELVQLVRSLPYTISLEVRGSNVSAARALEELTQEWINNNQIRSIKTLRVHGRSELSDGKILAGLLRAGLTLTKVSFDNNELKDDAAQLLADAILCHEHLTALHLGFNNISDSGTECLADALLGRCALTLLDLQFNLIKDRGVRALLQVLPHSKLSFLDVGGNRLSGFLRSDISNSTSTCARVRF
jgi:hypothetical protein